MFNPARRDAWIFGSRAWTRQPGRRTNPPGTQGLSISGNAPELPDESEFQALRYFTLDGTDYPSHDAQQTAIASDIRWKNSHAHPKRHFAIHSKIRRPDYLPKAS
jgi:hypothetical protein